MSGRRRTRRDHQMKRLRLALVEALRRLAELDASALGGEASCFRLSILLQEALLMVRPRVPNKLVYTFTDTCVVRTFPSSS